MQTFLTIFEPLLAALIQTEGPVALDLLNGLLGKVAHQNGIQLTPTPAHVAPTTTTTTT